MSKYCHVPRIYLFLKTTEIFQLSLADEYYKLFYDKTRNSCNLKLCGHAAGMCNKKHLNTDSRQSS